MRIEGGTGTSYTAGVTDEFKLEADCISSSIEHHANQEHGDAYAVDFAVNPDAAGDCFLYLKNNSEKDMVVEGVWLSMSGADEVQCKIGDTGTAVKTNGADVTPVNLNAGSGSVADCLCYSETADGAVDITGLSGGSTFQTLHVVAAADSKYFNFEADVVIPKNSTLTLYAVGGDVLIRGSVIMFFHD